jgi:hypothetical protein
MWARRSEFDASPYVPERRHAILVMARQEFGISCQNLAAIFARRLGIMTCLVLVLGWDHDDISSARRLARRCLLAMHCTRPQLAVANVGRVEPGCARGAPLAGRGSRMAFDGVSGTP